MLKSQSASHAAAGGHGSGAEGEAFAGGDYAQKAARQFLMGKGPLNSAALAGLHRELVSPPLVNRVITAHQRGAALAQRVQAPGKPLRQVVSDPGFDWGAQAVGEAGGEAPGAPGSAAPAAPAAADKGPSGAAAVQAKAAPGSAQPRGEDPGQVAAGLGEGAPLGGAAARMEEAFGDSFGSVRIHEEAAAGQKARDLGARAFTMGTHIAFAPGQYQPGTPAGDALLAHELAHVQQQRGSAGAGEPAAAVQRKAETGASEAHEQDADQAAAGVLARLYGAGKRFAGAAAGRIGAAMTSGLALQRCPDGDKGVAPTQQPSANPPQPVTPPPAPLTPEAEAEKALAAPPAPAEIPHILDLLRRATPIGKVTAQTHLDDLIVANLSGDARWRALLIHRFGPESNWPPEVRGDTALIISKARERIAKSPPDPAADVADSLRPLNETARHQVITFWRDNIPASNFGDAKQRTAYFDLLSASFGASYAPKDDLSQAPPLLDLDTKSEAVLYSYFLQVCQTRGFTMHETDTSDPKNPIQFNAFNIREYDRTTTAAQKNPRLTGDQFTGRLFLVWRDLKGDHVKNWEWSNTGIGGSKSKKVAARADALLADEGKTKGFDKDARGQVSRDESKDVAKEKDAATLAGQAAAAAAAAETAAADAGTKAQQALSLSADRHNADTPTTGTRAVAEAALAGALEARHQASLAAAEIKRARRLLGKSAPPAGVDLDASEKQATSAKDQAQKSFDTAKQAWLMARQQGLSNNEETALASWQKIKDDPAVSAADKEKARASYDAAQKKNNNAFGEGNTGPMSENYALPWLQEGQYMATLRSGKKGGQPFWAVNSGVEGKGGASGLAPADRDWSASGKIDPGERDVPATAIGTGILIHRGDSTGWSIGCQVAPEDPFKEFVKALSSGGSPAGEFSYVVVEARHLPALAPAAPKPGAGGP